MTHEIRQGRLSVRVAGERVRPVNMARAAVLDRYHRRASPCGQDGEPQAQERVAPYGIPSAGCLPVRR